MKIIKFLIVIFCTTWGQSFIQAQNKDKALQRAVRFNDTEKIRKLIKEGANVNYQDENKATTLMWALYRNDLSTFKFLVDQNADLKEKGFIWVNEETGSYYGNLNAIAVSLNDLEKLKYLIEDCKIPVDDREFNPTDQKENGWTALQWAVYLGNKEIIAYLIQKKANLNIYDGSTPLISAISRGHFDVVQLLIESGADLMQKDSKGFLPHHHAMFKSSLETLTLLKEKGVDIFTQLPSGLSPLAFAVQNNYYKLARFYINLGVDPNTSTAKKLYPLQWAAKNGYDALAKKMINNGAVIDVKDDYGLTPLMYAAYNNQAQIAKLLLEHKADSKLQSQGQKTALDYAKERKADRVITLLENPNEYKEPNQFQQYINKMVMFYNAQLYNEAIAVGEVALEYAYQSYGKNSDDYASSLRNLAQLYSFDKRYKQADSLYLIAEAFHAQDSDDYWEILQLRARNLENQLEITEALKIYERILNHQKETLGVKNQNYINTLKVIAYLQIYLGHYDLSRKYYAELLNLQKKVTGKQDPEYAEILRKLSYVHQNLGEPNKALEFITEAHEIYKQLKDTKQYNLEKHIDIIANMALVHYALGNYAKSKFLFEARVMSTIHDNLNGKHPQYTAFLNNLATLYLDMGQLELAEKKYKETLRLKAKSVGTNSTSYANTLSNLGDVYVEMNRYQEAENNYHEALRIRKVFLGEDHPYYGITINNLATLYHNSSNYKEAEKYYQQFVQIQEKNFGQNNLNYALAIHNLGSLYEDLNKYKEAEKMTKKALQIREAKLPETHPLLGLTYFNLASMYFNQDKPKAAYPYFQKHLKNRIEIIQTFFKFMTEHERLNFILSIDSEFEQFYHFALRYTSIYPTLVKQALNVRLKIKGLLFQSDKKIKTFMANSQDEAIKQLYQDYLKQVDLLNKVYQYDREALRKQNINIEAIKKEIETYQNYFSMVGDLSAKLKTNWEDIQKALKPDDAAIEIISYQTWDTEKRKFATQYAAIVLMPDTIKHAFLRQSEKLDKAFVNYYRNRIKYKKKDTKSYQFFWAEIDKLLQNPQQQAVKHIYFSPDGVYHQVNISTLFNSADKQYLLEKYDLQTVTNLNEILVDTIKQRDKAKDDIILFGYPNYAMTLEDQKKLIASDSTGIQSDISPSPTLAINERGQTFTQITPLPGTMNEVKNIEKLAQKHQFNTKTFIGDMALEENVKSLDNPKVLHIATHGYFLDNVQSGNKTEKVLGESKSRLRHNPMLRSGLMLSGAERNLKVENLNANFENGILTAYEARNLRLDQTELVVLSACETGLGEIQNGEGVYGLQRAFKIAGAEALLMSLWTVDDAATQKLMTLFYQNWLSGMPKRAAFRNAQQTLMEEFPEPYYWGAFLMIGN